MAKCAGIAPIGAPFFSDRSKGWTAAGLWIALVFSMHSGAEAQKAASSPSGASFEYSFPSVNGKTSEAPPMPNVRRIAVWGNDPTMTDFAKRLARSGRYTVVPPDIVAEAVGLIHVPEGKPRDLTAESNQAFENICRKDTVDFVFTVRTMNAQRDAVPLRGSTSSVSASSAILGYQCAIHDITWRDEFAFRIGNGRPLTQTQTNDIAGGALASRVLHETP